MRALWTGALAACLAASRADASDTTASVEDPAGFLPVYSEQSWDQRDGLPQSTVTGIVANPDGTLLLSTFAGLATFDGQRAVPLDASGPFANVSQITVLREVESQPGSAWIGTVGAGLWRRDGEAFQPLQPAPLYDATVWDVDEQDGQLLVSSSVGGFLRSREGRWSQVAGPIHRGRFGADGARWLCGSENRALFQTAAGEETPLALPPGELCHTGIVDPDGDFWVLGRNALFLADTTGAVLSAKELPLQVGWGQSPHLDQSGTLWVGAKDSVLALGPWQQVKSRMQDGRPLAAQTHAVGVPRSWYSSESGAMWVGTVGEGLVRLAPLGFSQLAQRPGRGSRGAGPVHGLGGSAWYTSDCSDLQVRTASGEHRAVPLPDQGAEGPLCIDALWASDDQAFVLRGRRLLLGTAEGLSLVPGAPWTDGNRPTAVEGRSDGGAWVGTGRGELWSYDGGILGPAGSVPPGEMGSVLDLLVRQDGSLAVGHSTGLCVLRDQTWACWSESEGLAPGPVRHVAEDPSGLLWYATYGGGLGWLDGDQPGRTPIGETGISDRFLSSVLIDESGSLWLQGNAGVTRVQLTDLHAHRLDPSRPLRTELIEVGESNGYLRHSAALLENGQAWLAGVGGIAVVDTRSFRNTGPPNPPLLRTAAMGDETLDLTGSNNQTSPNAFRRLEVHYAAQGLEQGRVWFEHRLVRDNKDADWVEAGSAQTAVYTGLRPGPHRFEVRKVGLDGKRSPPATLTVFVTPKWWERSTLRLAGLVALFLGLAFLLTLRTRGVARRAHVLQQEVDRRLAAEKRLRAREARFREVFDQSVNGFVLHSADGTCLAANPAACALFGLDRETLLKTPRDSLGLPQGPLPDSSEPVLCSRASGEPFAARVDEVSYDSESGPRVLTSLVDLTALYDAQNQERTLRRQLAAAQRLEALGRLAGGVAHDMNNVLAAISSNLELLEDLTAERNTQNDDEVRLCLADARTGVLRGSSMVRQLLSFRPQQEPQTEAAQPEAVVRSLTRMLSQLLPDDRSLEVVTELVGSVRMSPTELEQVVLNLVLNASDAVPPDGTVRLLLSAGPTNGTVCLAVEDDGPGITADVLEHLFEPFYTTKAQGEGTGLGLPTVKSVVEKAGGTITVQTGPTGSRFEVLLPTDQPLEEARQRSATPVRGDGSLIVLVDDDPGVRRSVKRQLTRAGWTVEDYRDPLVARDRLLGEDDSPALLVTDVLMPGLNGKQLARLATQRHPGLKVLFVSGYTGDVLGTGATDGHPLLPKPFQRETLLHLVHRLVTTEAPHETEQTPSAAQA